MSPQPRAFRLPLLLSSIAAAAFQISTARADDVPTKVLVALDENLDLDAASAGGADLSLVHGDRGTVLRVQTGTEADWPGATFRAPAPWDLSALERVAVQVRNLGQKPVTVRVRVDGEGSDPEGSRGSVTDRQTLQPGESGTVRVRLRRRLPPALADKLFGMRGYPGGLDKDKGVEAARITRVLVFVGKPKSKHVFEIDAIRAEGRYEEPAWLDMAPERFFPMIDRFGQFIHKDWPGKTHSEEDLRKAIEAEAADLAAHGGPDGWDPYGGWEAGPKLRATGFFHTEKHEGKWWLVDPEGRLFWSHGADCVRASTAYTPITDREFYFHELPGKDTPFAPFYGSRDWAPHGYYHGKGPYRTYNFTGSNLLRKYGPGWEGKFADLCHRRLRSWGMNTIANWSDERIYLIKKTPYCVSISAGGRRPIEGSQGYWGKFPDPFEPSFRKALDQRMSREKGKSAGDPWCLGYFVDNELGWGDELSLAVAALASPPDQASKRVFAESLKAKYETIDKLNAAWGTQHASWDALLDSRTPPDTRRARDDLAAFYTRIAEEYFRVSRAAVKDVAPDNLYLGCRFAWVNDRAVRAAAGHCDVIGFNKYRYSVADFALPEGIDKPVIIGEFHFGALDRGMFHTGLRPVEDQQARATTYKEYVRGALQNPYLVGTHWFQFGDQATTGRGDGENYQIGLLDVCDRPYPETIRAVRDVGYALYETRLLPTPRAKQ